MFETVKQYDGIVNICNSLFINKMKDYGTSWRILRPTSLTDQVFIKANRIRQIEIKKVSKIKEGVESEYVGIINYSLMAIIQLKFLFDGPTLYDNDILDIYNTEINDTKELMMNKNHDYGEAWREMRISSLTDMILQKLLRVKQIEDNDGNVNFSEGLIANFQDIINYSIFALIRISEIKEQPQSI